MSLGVLRHKRTLKSLKLLDSPLDNDVAVGPEANFLLLGHAEKLDVDKTLASGI